MIYYTVTIPPNSSADLNLSVHGKLVKTAHLLPGNHTYVVNENI